MEKNKSQQFYEKTGIINCLENEIAFCIAECPFHFNIPEFINKIQRGRFDSAFKDFKNAVGFPRIALELCDERCKDVCPRRSKDAPLQLKYLEKAVIKYARNTNPTEYNLPKKDKKIAIVGAGICGLACALRLCEKKYHVNIYEKADRIGGHLWEIMEPSVFLEDFEKQFMYEQYGLCLNNEIKSIDSLADQYDAIFIATGSEGFTAEGRGIFRGGALLGKNALASLVDGLESANQIESYLKTGIVQQTNHQYCTRQPLPNMEKLTACYPKRLKPEEFSEDEAKQEAGRCLQCKCDICRRDCDLLLYYKKSPMKVIEEVRATTEVRGVLAENMTIATKMIASCSQCGLCAEICPEHIDFKTVMLEARRTLHRKGALPWAFNDFFLRDMAHANNDAEVTIQPCPSKKPRYIFFPGCQLGASDPRYVTDSYRLLLEYYPDTVLINRCCGAPAVWAGDEELQNQVFAEFETKWQDYDKPELLFACPTCKKMFEDYLPEINGKFIYSLFSEMGVRPEYIRQGLDASVFDPCNSRTYPEVQSHVRRLSERAGFILHPLEYEKSYAGCCGFGGSSRIVNPEKANDTAKRRIAQGENLFITYCVNCRDIFADHGKEALHILDIILNINTGRRSAPTVTQRRRNRETLKRRLLEEFHKTEDNMVRSEEKLPDIVISNELKQRLSRNFILEDDISEVIACCEMSGGKVMNMRNGSCFGHKKIGHVTHWVEYRCHEGIIELVNAYSHRITIEE